MCGLGYEIPMVVINILQVRMCVIQQYVNQSFAEFVYFLTGNVSVMVVVVVGRIL